MAYLNYIRSILPENCRIQPQANLASFISRTDGAKYQNELFRNVDFIVTDLAYRPLFVIEINDQTHLAPGSFLKALWVWARATRKNTAFTPRCNKCSTLRWNTTTTGAMRACTK